MHYPEFNLSGLPKESILELKKCVQFAKDQIQASLSHGTCITYLCYLSYVDSVSKKGDRLMRYHINKALNTKPLIESVMLRGYHLSPKQKTYIKRHVESYGLTAYVVIQEMAAYQRLDKFFELCRNNRHVPYHDELVNAVRRIRKKALYVQQKHKTQEVNKWRVRWMNQILKQLNAEISKR